MTRSKAPFLNGVLGLIVASSLALPAFAAKPDSPPGQGKGKGQSEASHKSHEASEKHGSGKGKGASPGGQGNLVAGKGVFFEDRHRDVLRDWLGQEYQRGSCPPGLAKKRNGCMPPGQAKKWQLGHVLPRDVIYYSLPAAILRELGRAPDGHKYVRVGADILLLAIGTGMVVDAIEDLSSL